MRFNKFYWLYLFAIGVAVASLGMKRISSSAQNKETAIRMFHWGSEVSLGTGPHQNGGTFTIQLGNGRAVRILQIEGDISMIPFGARKPEEMSETLVSFWPAQRGFAWAEPISSPSPPVPYQLQETDPNFAAYILKTAGDTAQNLPVNLNLHQTNALAPNGRICLTYNGLQPTGGTLDVETQVTVIYQVLD